MSTTKNRNELEELLNYENNANKLRTSIPEEYGKGALVAETVFWGDFKVAIYGAGNCGAAVYIWLKEKGIDAEFFVDSKKTGSLFEKPILDLTEAARRFDGEKFLVLIAVNSSYYENNLIKKKLLSIDASKVIRRDEIEVNLNLWTFDILTHKQELSVAFDYLADDESQKAYIEYFRTHLTRDFWRYAEYDFTEKYFCEELFDIKKVTHYICCGGYTGDNILRFSKKNPRFESVVVYEPQEKYMNPLQESIDLLPKNVGKKIRIIEKECKDVNNATAATIDSEFSGGVGPILISMDIEGGEFLALKGAEKTISQNPPIFALSAYHKFDDFPVFIEYLKNRGEYKFFARKYRSSASVPSNEIVLYAVPALLSLK